MRKKTHLVCFVFLLAVAAVDLRGSDVLKYSVVFTQIRLVPELHGHQSAWSFLLNRAAEDRSRVVRLSPDGSLANLTPEFAAAADPCVSFDGRRILFAARRLPASRWDIWEMDADGGGKRQITQGLGDCREPEYLALSSITPPEFDDRVRWITFVSNAAAAYQEGSAELATSLYVTNLEHIQGRGFVTWRTTFNLSSDFSPTVLRDGRVLFTSGQRSGSRRNGQWKFPLLAANWDGTGLNLFCGDAQGAAFKTMACEMTDRNLVFVESPNLAGLAGGLARVSFSRPLHSYQKLSRDKGHYLYPHAFPDGRLAASYTPGEESYGIYFFDFDRGVPGKKIFDDPKYEDIDARPVITRPEPQGLISSVVDSLDWGELHCISVYESDRPQMARLRKGEITRARFVEGIPAHAPARKSPTPVTDPPVAIRIIGEAPVEQDGSFFVRLPADTPFLMELFNGRGQMVQRTSRWIWVRRGTSRGCIGCHENKELAPENRVTDALKRAEPHVFHGR